MRRVEKSVADTNRVELSEQTYSLLAFAQLWMPFGGGSAEDIWERFGIVEREYFTRVQRLLDEPAATALEPQVRDQLRQVCATRLR